MPDSPGPVPNPKPYMLWCCIKMRSTAYLRPAGQGLRFGDLLRRQVLRALHMHTHKAHTARGFSSARGTVAHGPAPPIIYLPIFPGAGPELSPEPPRIFSAKPKGPGRPNKAAVARPTTLAVPPTRPAGLFTGPTIRKRQVPRDDPLLRYHLPSGKAANTNRTIVLVRPVEGGLCSKAR
jgi:hypothetical protein